MGFNINICLISEWINGLILLFNSLIGGVWLDRSEGCILG